MRQGIILGGGGGADTSFVTASAGDVLKDKVIVGPDGEPLTGTLALSGDATAAQVLNGKTFYNTDAKSKLTGTLAIQSAISFSAAARSSTTIRISWKNPSKGPWTGVKIRMSTSGYPGVSGGTLKYTGTGSSAVAGATSYVDITGLSVGTTYYFTCYSYVTGLGDSTTGYNVSAKTKGLLLYDYGNNAYGLISGNIKQGYGYGVTFNSDHILIIDVQSETHLYIPAINYANYSKMCVIAYFKPGTEDPTRYYRYPALRMKKYSTAYYPLFEYKYPSECNAGTYTFTVPFSLTYNGATYFTYTKSNSSGAIGAHQDSVLRIYKIWLE